MNIFEGKHEDTVASADLEELSKQIEIVSRQLKAAVSKAKGHHSVTSEELLRISQKRSFLFTQIWTLSAAFGVLALIPLLFLRDQYPWAIFTAVCIGIVFILAIDVLSSVKEQHISKVSSKDLQGTSPDLTHRNTIDTTMNYEVEFWSAHFDVTPEELREAVEFVGPEVKNVRNYVHHKRTIADSHSAEPQ